MGVGGERLLAWYGAGDTDYRLPGTDMVFRVSAETAEFLRETRETTGALVFGRRTFDLTHGWGGNHPLHVPVFVVSSSAPPAWVSESTWCRSCWGGGVSLFDHLGTGPIDLERTRVIEGAGVTHLTFRVVK
jgi:dihydrofolate reductase